MRFSGTPVRFSGDIVRNPGSDVRNSGCYYEVFGEVIRSYPQGGRCYTSSSMRLRTAPLPFRVSRFSLWYGSVTVVAVPAILAFRPILDR
jgi:hypothetical protein